MKYPLSVGCQWCRSKAGKPCLSTLRIHLFKDVPTAPHRMRLDVFKVNLLNDRKL